MESADTVVIGGGAIGASIAYRLTEAGAGVTLIEKRAPSEGTSGATFAWVGAHGQWPFSYYWLRCASLALYPGFSQELGYEVEYRPQGSLVILKDEAERRLAEEEVTELREEGYDIHLLNQAELYSLEPSLAPGFSGATYCPLGGSVNPFRLVSAYLHRARELGAEVYCNTEVRDIRVKNCEVHSVITDAGIMRVKRVVNACGVFAPHIGRMAGLNIPVRPVRGQILVTEPLPLFIKYIVDGVRQTPHGNLLIGRLDEEAGYADICTVDGMHKLAETVLKVFPALRGAHIIRAYSGLRPMPSDELPILGEAEEVKGFFNAVMHSGLTLSPIIGIIMAQLICEGGTDIPVEDYSLSRFHK